MERLGKEIQESVYSLTVNIKTYTADTMTKNFIERELNLLSDVSNDIIWFYYSY